MKKTGPVVLTVGVLLFNSLPVFANDRQAIKEDNHHTRRWNGFAEKLLRLHDILTRQYPHTIKKRLGGYSHIPKFYREYKYINKKTGKKISQLQWEKAYPDKLHTIEVYIYDEYGRVKRDYSAAYLPDYRNAPTQTLINFHTYNGLLHAFRSFDASGDHVLDRCTGRYNSKTINILLDEDELAEGKYSKNGVIQSDTYKACFKGLPETAGKYLNPQ
ncbi:MAG: hypothetical protein OEY52_13380 [Gammaproteobacteria bacterium]|nr:hypothetical protein [Gammaproteobacteria bacterium]